MNRYHYSELSVVTVRRFGAKDSNRGTNKTVGSEFSFYSVYIFN